jgi:hypothetical protein
VPAPVSACSIKPLDTSPMVVTLSGTVTILGSDPLRPARRPCSVAHRTSPHKRTEAGRDAAEHQVNGPPDRPPLPPPGNPPQHLNLLGREAKRHQHFTGSPVLVVQDTVMDEHVQDWHAQLYVRATAVGGGRESREWSGLTFPRCCCMRATYYFMSLAQPLSMTKSSHLT